MKTPLGVKKRAALFPVFVLLLAGEGLLAAQNRGAPSAAGPAAFPSLDASPQAYEYARRIAAGGTWRDLAEAALWASSVNAGPGGGGTSYMDRINAAAADLAAAPDLPGDPKERGDYVLTFLHRRFLKSYSEYQTRVDEILVSGRYNCVSSAVFYMVLGLSVGLDVRGVMTKDHAFATVNTGQEIIDVETTNPYGFNPGNRKEFHDAFGKTTGFAYTPVKNYRDRTAISPLELVSLILSNRISELERGKRFAPAVPLAVNRGALLGVNLNAGADQAAGAALSAAAANRAGFFEDPRRDMITRLVNLGAYFTQTGDEDNAIAWAVYAGERFPDQRWQELIFAAANNKLIKLIRVKKTAEARTALETLKPVLAGANYQTLDTAVLEAEAAGRVNGIKNPGEAEAALAFLDSVWERLPEKDRREMRTSAVLMEAERIGKTRDWAGGMRWLSGALERYGGNPRIESSLRIFRQNRVGELHNEFALLFNKRDYAAAKASIERSLREFPGERQFTQDLSMVEQALR
ncbi:MAG: hypothetical protein LBG84_05000 [Treponema sp.]|jgi:hypothetical protein|nr:hypothetical protein [Treponema sp.]